jgi:hypothetical protein
VGGPARPERPQIKMKQDHLSMVCLAVSPIKFCELSSGSVIREFMHPCQKECLDSYTTSRQPGRLVTLHHDGSYSTDPWVHRVAVGSVMRFRVQQEAKWALSARVSGCQLGDECLCGRSRRGLTWVIWRLDTSHFA